MKSTLILLLWIATWFSAQGQNPDSCIVFTFVDSLGHRDSISLCLSSLALPIHLDEELGEDLFSLHKPWDDTFEIRVLAQIFEKVGFSKKSALSTSLSDCVSHWDALVMLEVRCRYYPVTLYWDKTLFNSWSCLQNSVFQPTQFGPLQGWWDDAVLLKSTDSTVITKEMIKDHSTTNQDDTLMTRMIIKFEGRSSSIRQVPKSSSFIIYQHHGGEPILLLKQALHQPLITVSTLQGQLVYQKKMAGYAGELVQLSGLSNGLYVYQINTCDGRTLADKFIVTR